MSAGVERLCEAGDNLTRAHAILECVCRMEPDALSEPYIDGYTLETVKAAKELVMKAINIVGVVEMNAPTDIDRSEAQE